MKTPKDQFVKQLARFLVDNQAGKSTELQMSASNPKPAPLTNWPQEWALMRQCANLRGYPTLEEAEKSLADFLQ